MHFIFAIWLLFLNIQRNTWRNVFTYLPSMLYVICFNVFYYFLCYPYLHWDFRSSILSPKRLRILHSTIINPLAILLYLSNLPKSLLQKGFYFLKWIFLSLLVELVGEKFRLIKFNYGWNMFWSTFVYIQMYLLGFWIAKKPRFILTISMFITGGFLIIFKVPIKDTVGQNLKTVLRFIVKHRQTMWRVVYVLFSVILIIRTMKKLRIIT